VHIVAAVEHLESRTFFASGLSATYYDTPDFAGHSVNRVDPNVALSGTNHKRPAPGIKGNTYSVRWTGLLRPAATNTYTFNIRHSEGVRMWVGGQRVIDNWKPQAPVSDAGSIKLTAKRFYDIRIEYFDKLRDGGISLTWNTPGAAPAFIPTDKLTAYDQRFAVIGDFGFKGAAEPKMARLVQSWRPEFIVTVGDNNYPDGEAFTIDDRIGQYFYNYIGNYQGKYGKAPKVNGFFPALGNHDWGHDTVQPHVDYFTLPGNERYYDFVKGPIHFFILDSDKHEPDGSNFSSKQGKWFQKAIAASTSPFNIVAFHHAAYSSGEHGSSAYMQWPFKKLGVDLVLSGHDHDYERLNIDGLTYFVDGAGGGTRKIGSGIKGSIVRNDAPGGALLVQNTGSMITLQYQLPDGTIIDTFTTDSAATSRT